MANTYTNSGATARQVRARDVWRRAATASDAEVMIASVRNPDAFTELFGRHWDTIYGFCLKRAGSAGEDIAAEAFRVAFDRRRRYDARHGDALPWLFGIATNLLRDHFRLARQEKNKLERSMALETPPPNGPDPTELERQLLGPELAAALLNIPAADRDALLLMAWADLGYEQIAQALDVPLGTVRSRIHRARQRVREHLQRADNELAPTKEA
jgi:RNA polymerase sigma-70 factor (ECF subfamily)